MPSGIKSQKHIDNQVKVNESRQQKAIVFDDNAMANVVNTIFWAWKGYISKEKDEKRIEQVCKLIVCEPENVAHLIGNAKKSITAFYALHNILLILSDKKPSDILAQMSDKNISEFKRAISIAKDRGQPDYDKTQKGLNACVSAKSGDHMPHNATMINAMQMQVDLKIWWDCVVPEFNKWSDAIDNHQAIKLAEKTVEAEEVKPQVVEVEDKETCTLAELASKLGYKNEASFSSVKSRLIKKYPELKEKIENWIVHDKKLNRNVFLVAHFDEFQELLKSAKAQEKADKQAEKRAKKQVKEPKIRALKKVVKEDVKKTKVSKVAKGPQARNRKYATPAEEQEFLEAVICESPKNMVDVKMLEYKLDALNQVLSGYKENIQKTEQEHEALMQQISKAEPAQRGALYDQARVLDQDIVLDQEKIVSTQNEIDKGNKLLQAKRDLDAQIAAFLAHGK